MDIRGAVEPAMVILVAAALVMSGGFVYFLYTESQPAAVLGVDTFDRVTIGVTDADSLDGVDNVKVTLTNAITVSDRTDEDGNATYLDLPAGSYTALAKAPAVDNYYWASKQSDLTDATASPSGTDTISDRIVLVRYGNGSIDNTIDSANRTIDNTFDEGVVSFGGIFKNLRADGSELNGAVVTLTFDFTGVVFENIESTAGTVTEVTDGIKYEIALGNIGEESSVFATIKLGISGVDDSSDAVGIVAKLNDTPSAEDDAGAAEVTSNFDIVVS